MNCFDFEKTARDAGLSDDQLSRLCKEVREDYPDDAMLYELHVLRACRAIRDRVFTFDEMLAGRPAAHEKTASF